MRRDFILQAVEWIRDKVKDAKARGIVMGLSGGVDSAVVSVLCQKAVGNKNLLCLALPCRSSTDDFNFAKAHIKKFRLNSKTVVLDPAYEAFCSILPREDTLSCANIKPRLRMTALYYFANSLNYLVAGTGNKSEISIGYFTKYGDGGVDILPIGGIYKTEVLELARQLGISEDIIKRPPTAGLWDGQTDEGEMQIRYRDLDETLKIIFSRSRRRPHSVSCLCRVRIMMKKTAHKRRMPEIFV